MAVLCPCILKLSSVVSTAFRVREQASTGAAEIVRMVIVAEERVIEWTARRAEGWAGGRNVAGPVEYSTLHAVMIGLRAKPGAFAMGEK